MVFSNFTDIKKRKLLISLFAVLFLLLVLTIGSPNFSLFQNLVKTTDQSSFDQLELRLPDISLAQSIGISVCELDYQNINQIEVKDYKKAIKGLSFLQKELNKNYKEDSLQSLITKILKNEYPLNENDTLCLPPLIISAKATEVIKGKEVSLASQKISCKGEAYLENKYGITDSLVNYSAYLKDNKVVNKLNKNLKNLELKEKSLNSPKQINNTNKNILRTTLARNTAKFYLKHSDKLITFYETLCLQAPEHEEQEETPSPTLSPSPSPSPATCIGADTILCDITNGTGVQIRTCNNGTWSNYGTCSLESCNFGYQISRNSCEEISNPTPTPTPATNRISPPTITSPTTSIINVNSTGEVTITWTAVSGAIGYLTRYQNITDGTAVVMNTNHTTTSLSFNPIIGKEYKFWVHSKAANFSYANPDSYSEQDIVFFTAQNVNPCTGSATQACNITNGTGIQTRTCNGGTWNSFGTCTVVSCNSGFQISGNSCVATVTSPFIKGDRVELIKNTNFRQSPALTGVLIQQLPTGRVGTIVGDNAIKNDTDTFTWREVDFGLGQVSYAGEDNYKKHETPTPSPVTCQNGTTTTRTRYQNPSVPHGQACVPQTQTGTCVNGAYTNWTGTYTNTNCYVESVNHCASGSASSISQFGFTWTFDRAYQCGQFVNGDYWVVGSVRITNITPKDTTPSDSEDLHGTMINPTIGVVNGWDSRIQRGSYNAGLNIAKKLPYTVTAGSSVCSAKSFAVRATKDNPMMEEIAVLTVLASAPPTGSFRPPLMGTNKAVSWNESQLNYGVLKSLPPVAATPDLATVTEYFKRPWIEKEDGWQGRYYHPWNNHPFQNRNLVGTYGREMAHTAADGLLSLQLNYTNSQKRLLLIRMVQAGIDIFGTARIGGYWGDGGGHNQGRKMVLLLAGMVLNDANMLAFANAGAGSNRKFQEDLQTFYVTQADVDRKLVSVNGVEIVPYLPTDKGMPEWAINYKDEPHRSNKRWITPYRVVAGPCTLGHVLTAKIMNAKALWNHPATFDYYERWYQVEKNNVAYSTNSIQPFVKNMWVAYGGGGGG